MTFRFITGDSLEELELAAEVLGYRLLTIEGPTWDGTFRAIVLEE